MVKNWQHRNSTCYKDERQNAPFVTAIMFFNNCHKTIKFTCLGGEDVWLSPSSCSVLIELNSEIDPAGDPGIAPSKTSSVPFDFPLVMLDFRFGCCCWTMLLLVAGFCRLLLPLLAGCCWERSTLLTAVLMAAPPPLLVVELLAMPMPLPPLVPWAARVAILTAKEGESTGATLMPVLLYVDCCWRPLEATPTVSCLWSGWGQMCFPPDDLSWPSSTTALALHQRKKQRQ